MALTAVQIGQLLDRHWMPLLVWVGGCHGAEEDVVQEAFVRLAAMDPPPDSPAAWLYVVARNLANSTRTSYRRRALRHQMVAVPERMDVVIDERLVRGDLRQALEQLPERFRRIVVARVWGEMSFEELGRMFDVSAATCRRRYHEGLNQLRKIYGVPCPIRND